jgi:toxin ParE1/3/4
MIHSYRFLSVCEEELADSIDHYGEISPELGRAFYESLDLTINKLLAAPEIGVPVGSDLRSFGIRKFPFNIIYKLDKHEIVIVAVAHHSRRPGYWRERIS